MKNLNKLMVVIVAIMTVVMPASAQLRFGVKAGVDLNSLDVTGMDYVKDHSTGFTAGVMADFTVPLIGIGFDASLMYARRSVPEKVFFVVPEGVVAAEAETVNKNYLVVPINLKYSLSLPAISSIVKPYIATGPSFEFNLSGNEKNSPIETQKANVSWNLGAGAELIKHIQIGVGYSWALGRVNNTKLDFADVDYEFKINGWTITAAYLF